MSGVVVRERIPDRLLNEADEVVVVDVTPETLEECLIEAKNYALEKINQVLQNFFQQRNLIALRELALREVADSIEENNSTTIAEKGYFNIHERVIVCLSTYPNSIRLLRRGARIASYMNARLYALFVDNSEQFLTKAESLYVETCEKLCREFGGEFLRVEGPDPLSQIIEIA